MPLETDDLDVYLRPTPVVDSDHPQVAARATDVTRSATNDVERAKALFEWVRDQIPHSYDIQSRLVTCAASQVLDKGTGICFAKSHLLAAMCRSQGIPAGLVYQRLQREVEGDEFVLHGFNAIYLESLDRWIRVDPRGNKPGVDAQFNLKEEQLAFPIDPARGEQIIDTIFADADPAVVEFLTQTADLLEGWADLPEDLRRPAQT
jgi:transglutaminase-like putative cysteine protease